MSPRASQGPADGSTHSRRLVRERQGEAERCASAIGLLQSYRASVRLHQAFDDRQTQARPDRLDRRIVPTIVLVTTSSEFQDDGRLVQAALDGLADEPFAVVATMPAGAHGQFYVLANARVEGFVPHGPVLDRAVCAVTHGGMGATQKALARAVPVCAVPFGRDQLEVARRVEVAEAGTRLPAKRLSPQRLRQKFREAMTKVEGAKRVAAGFAAAGGAMAAAEAFESRLLNAARPPQAVERDGASVELGLWP